MLDFERGALSRLCAAALPPLLFAVSFLWRYPEASYHVALADAAFVTAVVTLSVCGLVFLFGEGVFDIFTYSLGRLFHPGVGYADYRAKRRRRRVPLSLVIWGGFYLLLAIILALAA